MAGRKEGRKKCRQRKDGRKKERIERKKDGRKKEEEGKKEGRDRKWTVEEVRGGSDRKQGT